MSVYIDPSNRLHHDHEHSLALSCPHCQVFSHISAVSIPRYADIVGSHPKHVGIVYRCDACNEPVFLKFAVKMYASNRVELATNFVQLEHARERFDFTHLPEEVESLFREALGCYSAGHFNAFASMCRRAARAAIADLGEHGRLRMFDQLNEAGQLAEIDRDITDLSNKVIFGSDADPAPSMPEIDAYEAGILLELVKDMLYQAYVRKGKLQQSMMVRRFFLEHGIEKITPIDRVSGSD
jgi:hypothetical protein